jgi:hypothetical protein
MPAFVTASGPSLFDASFLGRARDGSWWVGVVRRAPPGSKLPLDIGFRLGTKHPLSDLWQDPDGGLWVCGDNGVRINPTPWGDRDGTSDRWELRELDAPLHGITGVDARCVLTWGVRQSDGVHVLRLFNGARWNPVGGPGFAITACDLSAPDRIWACGDGVGRWNGEGWDVLDEPGLIALHAPSDDRVIVLRDDGVFGRVTPEGLAVLGHVEGARAIAVWRDRIWIGAGENGLWRAGGGEVVCVREDRHCVALEARGDSLLIGCTDLVSSTDDGERFPGGCRGVLEPLRLR